MKKFFTISVLLFFVSFLMAQNLRFNPYLQDATPNSIYILWETNYGDETLVEWGLTTALGNTTDGLSSVSNGSARIHTVQLEGLTRFTKYFYRVKTANAISDIFSFKTPPFASDHEPFRMVLMSDIQIGTSSIPNIYDDLIHEGIMDYYATEYGGDLIDNLAMILIPGDLVNTGDDYDSWRDEFFQFSDDLFNQVPVYPVPGNHEANTDNFFNYFQLPDNGSDSYQEHYWHKDYGNVRVIGLDSNTEYVDYDEQLAWFEAKLAETCASPSIDFVFAELHHPHKSELWTPGESDFTGVIIDRLEQFSTSCGKPSIHFFGHTHAYSRGQSRDHKHLWINVASAGGALDNWGEFPNFDYDEFSVSQDEYGFVSIEITDDADPKLVIKRISRGDQDVTLDNVIKDDLTIRLFPTEVSTPTPIYPLGDGISPECVLLKANSFSSPNPNASHGQSHWQVAIDENDFSNPIAESWKNFENWYYDIDTQAEDDLTDEEIPGLEENSTYWWRVRYRDKEFNWSNWSNAVSFSTGVSILSENLISNKGAEEDLNYWIIEEGVVEALTAEECNGINPHSGDKYFAVGGLCQESEIGILTQNIDVSEFSEAIDSDAYRANFGGYLSNYSGTDKPEMRLIFQDENNTELGSSEILTSYGSTWTLLSSWVDIPTETRNIKIELKGTRYGGTDNDSYFDDLFLRLGSNEGCEGTVGVFNLLLPIPQELHVIPNPIESTGIIDLQGYKPKHTKFLLVDASGSKVTCPVLYLSNQIHIDKGNLTQGTYFFWVKESGEMIGKGKFIVK